LSVVASLIRIVSGSASITIDIEPFGLTCAAAAGLAAGAAAGAAAVVGAAAAAGAAGLAGTAVGAGAAGLLSAGLAGAAVGAGAAGAQATTRTLVINTRLAALRQARSQG
jgi:hypothetical protein